MYIGSIDAINWDVIWNQQMELTSFKRDGVKFWNKKAKLFDNRVKSSNYVDELLHRMEISSEFSILDVECGTGAMAIPLAKRVRRVTALDLSPLMLKILIRNTATEGINNIVLVNKDWLQVKIGADIERHDVVLASRSLPMGNLRKALIQMHRAAKHLCYLTWIVGGNESDARICNIMDKVYHPFPGYIIIYNILYSMGIYANIEIFEISGKHRFQNLDEAVAETVRGCKVENNQIKQKLKAFLAKELSYQDGYFYKDITSKWVLIWWRKETR